jgi:hypothetical protein
VDQLEAQGVLEGLWTNDQERGVIKRKANRGRSPRAVYVIVELYFGHSMNLTMIFLLLQTDSKAGSLTLHKTTFVILPDL